MSEVTYRVMGDTLEGLSSQQAASFIRAGIETTIREHFHPIRPWNEIYITTSRTGMWWLVLAYGINVSESESGLSGFNDEDTLIIQLFDAKLVIGFDVAAFSPEINFRISDKKKGFVFVIENKRK